MKISSIKIERLFGSFDYEINLTENINPLILTGLNGYGKTTILTIINKLSEKDLFYFYSLPFSKICIYFDNYNNLVISSSETTEKDNNEESDSNLTKARIVKFEWFIEDKFASEVVFDKDKIRSAIRQLGFYRRTEFNTANFVSKSFYRFVKENEYFYNYFRAKNECKFLFLMLDGFKVTFVEAQRIICEKQQTNSDDIYRRKNTEYIQKVADVSEKLKNILSSANIRYLKSSQTVDSKIIDCLLTSEKSLDEADYNKKKLELEKRITELVSFGLIEKTEIKPYDNNHVHVLTVYLENLDEKLNNYNKILPKLQLFSNMITSLNFVNKTIAYNPNNGLVAKSQDGKFLDLDMLSSGEQNEIVMLYYMIFEVADDTVLLIDEPEISLHVAWQNNFYENLSQIAESKNLQVIMATHSPQIIGERWNKCLDLCELLSNE